MYTNTQQVQQGYDIKIKRKLSKWYVINKIMFTLIENTQQQFTQGKNTSNWTLSRNVFINKNVNATMKLGGK